jgi:hypothetical protein
MQRLTKQLSELERVIPALETLNHAVSQVPVGWHIDHTLLVISAIIARLQTSNPSTYRWQFNLTRLVVMATGRFPRGRGKSPEAVMPDVYDVASLSTRLQAVCEDMQTLNTIHPGHYFEHPYFGQLQLKAAQRFLVIHTNHHLRIIRDIMQ